MRTGQQSVIDKWSRWKAAIAAEKSGEDPMEWVLRRSTVDGETQWCKRCFMSGEVWVTLWIGDIAQARHFGRQAVDFLAEYCTGQSGRHYLSAKWIAYEAVAA